MDNFRPWFRRCCSERKARIIWTNLERAISGDEGTETKRLVQNNSKIVKVAFCLIKSRFCFERSQVRPTGTSDDLRASVLALLLNHYGIGCKWLSSTVPLSEHQIELEICSRNCNREVYTETRHWWKNYVGEMREIVEGQVERTRKKWCG